MGDLSYDVAKLTHSIIGLYDYIIAGAYRLDVSFELNTFTASLSIHIDDRIVEIQELFLRGNYFRVITPVDVMPSVVLLFLSMLPLHAENKSRQLALFANALRIYNLYVKDKVK